MPVMQRLLIIIGFLLAASCSDKSKASEGDPKSQKQPESTTPLPAVDDGLMAQLRTLLKTCELPTKTVAYLRCPGKELHALRNTFKKETGDRTLATLAVALAGADKDLTAAAALVASGGVRGEWDKHLEKASKPVAALLRQAILKLGLEQQKQILFAVVSASFHADDVEAFDTMTDRLTDPGLKTRAWAMASEFDRAKYLPKVKETAEEVTAAALEVGGYGIEVKDSSSFMYSEEDSAQLCSWAFAYLNLSLPEPQNYNRRQINAGQILITCGGEWIDKLLDWLAARLKANEFDIASAHLHTAVCRHFLASTGLGKMQGTKEQCTRNDGLLEQAIDNDALPAKKRADALRARATYRTDAEELLNKYAAGSPEFAEAAEAVRATHARSATPESPPPAPVE